MDTPSPPPRETRDRMCPHCSDLRIVSLGRVVTSRDGVRADYRCSGCAKEFILLR